MIIKNEIPILENDEMLCEKNGTLYGIGVGPGDPDLLTLKAVKVLAAADVIACPAKGDSPGIAYQIAALAYPGISGKERLLLNFPMKKGDQIEAHQKAAKQIESRLQMGKTVAFLTLGDPGFYSTFSYISAIVKRKGFEIDIINGVPSFCAAAARLQIPIAAGEESVMITTGEFYDFDGTLIVMKAGNNLKALKKEVETRQKSAYLVENVGMKDERVYNGVSNIPDQTGYFSILIVV